MPIHFLGESIRNWKRDSKQTDCHWTGQEFMNSEYCSVRIIFKMIHQLDWCNAIPCSLPCLSLCRMDRNYHEMLPYLDRDVFSLPRRCSKNSALFNLRSARCEIICSISQSPWLSGQARSQKSIHKIRVCIVLGGITANTPNPKGRQDSQDSCIIYLGNWTLSICQGSFHLGTTIPNLSDWSIRSTQ